MRALLVARHRVTVRPVSALDNGAGAPGRGVSRDPPDQARLGQLAEEQAALRRVATLVARGAAPEEVFTAGAGVREAGLRSAVVTPIIVYQPAGDPAWRSAGVAAGRWPR